MDTTNIHYKGKFANIYEVEAKYPMGGVEGDYVDIMGWAHYWHADRGTWCVNEKRDEYWDELIGAMSTKIKDVQDYLNQGWIYGGVIHPSAVAPENPGRLFYVAATPGDYPAYGFTIKKTAMIVAWGGTSWIATDTGIPVIATPGNGLALDENSNLSVRIADKSSKMLKCDKDGLSLDTVEAITYEELRQKILNETLIAGKRYTFEFTSVYKDLGYSSNHPVRTGNTYTLTVTAENKGKLNPYVHIGQHPDWIVMYDPSQTNTERYGWAAETDMGQITYLRDSDGNESYYDHASIKTSYVTTSGEMLIAGMSYPFEGMFNSGNLTEDSEDATATLLFVSSKNCRILPVTDLNGTLLLPCSMIENCDSVTGRFDRSHVKNITDTQFSEVVRTTLLCKTATDSINCPKLVNSYIGNAKHINAGSIENSFLLSAVSITAAYIESLFAREIINVSTGLISNSEIEYMADTSASAIEYCIISDIRNSVIGTLKNIIVGNIIGSSLVSATGDKDKVDNYPLYQQSLTMHSSTAQQIHVGHSIIITNSQLSNVITNEGDDDTTVINKSNSGADISVDSGVTIDTCVIYTDHTEIAAEASTSELSDNIHPKYHFTNTIVNAHIHSSNADLSLADLLPIWTEKELTIIAGKPVVGEAGLCGPIDIAAVCATSADINTTPGERLLYKEDGKIHLYTRDQDGNDWDVCVTDNAEALHPCYRSYRIISENKILTVAGSDLREAQGLIPGSDLAINKDILSLKKTTYDVTSIVNEDKEGWSNRQEISSATARTIFGDRINTEAAMQGMIYLKYYSQTAEAASWFKQNLQIEIHAHFDNFEVRVSLNYNADGLCIGGHVVYYETVRMEDFAEQQKQEKLRQQAEETRERSESLRQTNEAARNTQEKLRRTNEAARQQAEELRASAEAARQQTYEELKSDVAQVIQETENIDISLDDSVIKVTDKSGETKQYDVTLSKVNAELEGSVVKITDKAGNTKEIDLLDATEERVVVQLKSDVEGVSTAGLVLNVYYNDTDTPVQYTTDERGTAVFKVENGNKYRIVYPDIDGCIPIPDVEYVAAASERTITEWYKTVNIIDTETVFLSFRLYHEDQATSEPYTNGKATITYGDVEEVLTADSNGQARTTVPLGTEYTVSIEKPSDCHLMGGRYVHTYKADKTQRAIIVNLHEYLSSFLVVDKDGGEWTLDAWQQSGRDNSEAVLIHVCTDELLQNNGDFLISVDGFREHKYDYNVGAYSNLQWVGVNVEFTSIPLNGNNKTADYYYDGLTASQLIIGEGIEKGILTPAFSKIETEHFALGPNNLQAFIGSVGQWQALIDNATYVDELLVALRPEGTHLYSTWTQSKWTSTQQSATHAFNVASFISSNLKYLSYAAVPFYAPITL